MSVETETQLQAWLAANSGGGGSGLNTIDFDTPVPISTLLDTIFSESSLSNGSYCGYGLFNFTSEESGLPSAENVEMPIIIVIGQDFSYVTGGGIGIVSEVVISFSFTDMTANDMTLLQTYIEDWANVTDYYTITASQISVIEIQS